MTVIADTLGTMQDSGGFAGYEESLKGQNEGFAGLSLPGGLPNPFAKEEEPQGKRVRVPGQPEFATHAYM